MSKVIVHIHPFSPPCQAIILLANYHKCADQIDFKFVDLTKGGHKTPEFLAINPYHTVPTLQHDDTTLYESPAIVQYLAEHFKWEGDYGFPTDAKGRWAVINVLHKYHNIVRNQTAAVLGSWFATFFSKGAVPFNKEAMIKGLGQAKEEWKVLDGVLAQNNGFLTGKPSIADVLAFSPLYRLTKGVEGQNYTFSIYDFDEHPHIKQWLANMAKLFVNDELECWKVANTVIGMSKQMIPEIVLLE